MKKTTIIMIATAIGGLLLILGAMALIASHLGRMAEPLHPELHLCSSGLSLTIIREVSIPQPTAAPLHLRPRAHAWARKKRMHPDYGGILLIYSDMRIYFTYTLLTLLP